MSDKERAHFAFLAEKKALAAKLKSMGVEGGGEDDENIVSEVRGRLGPAHRLRALSSSFIV